MVVVVLLAVIVIGLTAMFGQVQRAFRAGMTQTDVLEAGRMATEMISRELEQVTPGYGFNPSFVNTPNAPLGPNVLVQLGNSFVQPLIATQYPRTNIQDDLFFITHENQTWRGIGYFVRSNENLTVPPVLFGAVGTLYRFEMEQTAAQFSQAPDLMFDYFEVTRGFLAPHNGIIPTNYSKIMDGVIALKVRTYDRTNNWFTPDLLGYVATNYTMITNGNVVLTPLALVEGEVGKTAFYSNAVPAFVDFELAIVEPHTYERYKSIPVLTAQTNYLAQQVGRVHVFRQRVAIRNVDPAAY